jgi:predicted TIM-barrel fold metal-dependent hydrolase
MTSQNVTIISSDGHAGASMANYRPYLDASYREEFDDFINEWNEFGSRNFDSPALARRLDPEFVDEWNEKMVNTGRLDGYTDPILRLKDAEREGIAAEVLFPDFGLPFELYSSSLAAALGHPPLDDEHRHASYQAFNRWIVDYISVAPERFAGQGIVSWSDTERAVEEIRSMHRSGLRGLVLPAFDPAFPLYHEVHEPIWSAIDELGLVVNSHGAMSSTTNRIFLTPGLPHPALAIRLYVPEMLFFTHNILVQLIWGGVLQRHPAVKFVFTEQGSAWVIRLLAEMDYAYERSYFRSDYKGIIPHKPSEYFAQSCYLGSSLFSEAEVRARHEFGVNKMMLGMDYPHHEGTLLETTPAYLRATIGAAGVPPKEAEDLLCNNAAAVFGFDRQALKPVANRIGLKLDDILAEPVEDLFPRGDVHKPLGIF